MIENFIPKVHESGHFVEMLVRAERCPICGKIMIVKSKSGVFPHYNSINQEAQAKKIGLVFMSETLVDDFNICEECDAAGVATFVCEICGERKPTNKIEERVGDDLLCSDCYASVSAKKWNEILDQLWEKHRYD